MHKRNWLIPSALAAVALLSAGCGSGGSSSTDTTNTATGYFVDSGVEGVQFSSASGNGITAAQGAFTYTEGETVTFAIGGLELGSAPASSVITPMELADDNNVDAPQVNNRVRLLMALDDDANASNGIQISEADRLKAEENWTTPDFNVSEAAFAEALYVAMGSDAGSLSLPTAAEATTHLTSTLQCVYSGGFAGTWRLDDGSDGGSWGVIVFPDGKTVGGSAGADSFVNFSDGNRGLDKTIGLSGPLYDINASGAAISTGITITLSGTFSDTDHISGTFTGDNDSGISGTNSAHRVGGSQTAMYRYTGYYYNDNGLTAGVFTMDIDGSGNVTGFRHDFELDNEASMEGNVTGSTLNLLIGTTTVTGTIDLANGTLTNVIWEDPADGSSGTASGAGCKLN